MHSVSVSKNKLMNAMNFNNQTRWHQYRSRIAAAFWIGFFLFEILDSLFSNGLKHATRNRATELSVWTQSI